jgi:hypothetical protein
VARNAHGPRRRPRRDAAETVRRFSIDGPDDGLCFGPGVLSRQLRPVCHRPARQQRQRLVQRQPRPFGPAGELQLDAVTTTGTGDGLDHARDTGRHVRGDQLVHDVSIRPNLEPRDLGRADAELAGFASAGQRLRPPLGRRRHNGRHATRQTVEYGCLQSPKSNEGAFVQPAPAWQRNLVERIPQCRPICLLQFGCLELTKRSV